MSFGIARTFGRQGYLCTFRRRVLWDEVENAEPALGCPRQCQADQQNKPEIVVPANRQSASQNRLEKQDKADQQTPLKSGFQEPLEEWR